MKHSKRVAIQIPGDGCGGEQAGLLGMMGKRYAGATAGQSAQPGSGL